MSKTEKWVKVLFCVFIIVFSINVLQHKVPETKFVKDSIESLEKSQQTITRFSGVAITTSLAISALPDDFASPLANTVSDLNKYFVFMFAVVFIEKLLVIEGTKVSLAWIIPIAFALYGTYVLTNKEALKNFATKILILGLSLILVIPVSTFFTETVCKDYLEYVDETIAETEAGADKINDVMASSDENATFFDKISGAFKNAIQSVSDLLTYFKNVIKKCVNSVAIMLVITFVLPLLMLMLFKWLLKELFAFNLNISIPKVRVNMSKRRGEDQEDIDAITTED